MVYNSCQRSQMPTVNHGYRRSNLEVIPHLQKMFMDFPMTKPASSLGISPCNSTDCRRVTGVFPEIGKWYHSVVDLLYFYIFGQTQVGVYLNMLNGGGCKFHLLVMFHKKTARERTFQFQVLKWAQFGCCRQLWSILNPSPDLGPQELCKIQTCPQHVEDNMWDVT